MANSLLEKLIKDYPNYNFCSSNKFMFRPPRTILFNTLDQNFNSLILHELGHATLGHRTFKTDIDRIKMERAAWNEAKNIAKNYHISIDDNLIESAIDSYRDWLHAKSKCKKCGLTKYQDSNGVYHCPYCDKYQ